MNIMIAGDFCPQNRVAGLFERGDYASVLGDIQTVVKDVDYSIVNLECPVCKGGEEPIAKWGVHLQCSKRCIEAVKWAGFDGVALANNHFLDYGVEGVINTLDACNEYGIDIVGGGKNLHEASKVLYIKNNGKALAIINCCEHEFSIATEVTAGSNPLNPVQQYYTIRKAKEKADYVLVIVHGGHEYYQLPSPQMQDTYRFFIDAGADAVVNHHQHCYSGYEIYNNKPIFYGIGNFCFDRGRDSNKTWYEGYMVILKMNNSISFEIIPYNQCSDEPCVRLLEKDIFNEELKKLNTVICNSIKLKTAAERYFESSSKYYSDILEPCNNRFYLACKYRGWLPSFITEGRKLRSANYICCESLREKLIYYLNQK